MKSLDRIAITIQLLGIKILFIVKVLHSNEFCKLLDQIQQLSINYVATNWCISRIMHLPW